MSLRSPLNSSWNSTHVSELSSSLIYSKRSRFLTSHSVSSVQRYLICSKALLWEQRCARVLHLPLRRGNKPSRTALLLLSTPPAVRLLPSAGALKLGYLKLLLSAQLQTSIEEPGRWPTAVWTNLFRFTILEVSIYPNKLMNIEKSFPYQQAALLHVLQD